MDQSPRYTVHCTVQDRSQAMRGHLPTFVPSRLGPAAKYSTYLTKVADQLLRSPGLIGDPQAAR